MTHRFEIEQSFMTGYYMAGCSCGWASEDWVPQEDIAEDEHDRHVEFVRTLAQTGTQPPEAPGA